MDCGLGIADFGLPWPEEEATSEETDEMVFSVNTEGYELSILNQDRKLSPEAIAAGIGTYRTHIPPDFDNSDTYVYYNGTIGRYDKDFRFNIKKYSF